MQFNTSMPTKLKPFFIEELTQAKRELSGQNYGKSWSHLERAHILGQPYPFSHTLVHWKMLRFALQIKSTREIIGQLPRLALGGIKSFVGKIPVGNTGGANVPPLKTMQIPEELANIINKHR